MRVKRRGHLRAAQERIKDIGAGRRAQVRQKERGQRTKEERDTAEQEEEKEEGNMRAEFSTTPRDEREDVVTTVNKTVNKKDCLDVHKMLNTSARFMHDPLIIFPINSPEHAAPRHHRRRRLQLRSVGVSVTRTIQGGTKTCRNRARRSGYGGEGGGEGRVRRQETENYAGGMGE